MQAASTKQRGESEGHGKCNHTTASNVGIKEPGQDIGPFDTATAQQLSKISTIKSFPTCYFQYIGNGKRLVGLQHNDTTIQYEQTSTRPS